MKNLIIPETENNPKFELNFQTKTLLIEGKWNINNDAGFKIRDQIIAGLSEYFKIPMQNLSINLKLGALSTSYSKILLDFFKYLEEAYLNAHLIEINWYCKSTDEDFIETGQDFKDMLKLPFNICEY
jgi:hypothetical protein